MLKHYINLPDLKLGKTIKKFSTALQTGRFSIRKDFSLVFLCGANKIGTNPAIPSPRRAFLKTAIEKTLPHAKVVYAEVVMEELIKHEKTKNLLDIEGLISHIADSILIVLESNSAFCELGAFAHMSLRDKLIVINDSQFKKSESFINLGPLQAIAESGEKERVLWYPMEPNGNEQLDAIGNLLPSVIRTLGKNRKHKLIDHGDCLPNASNQSSLFFLHDLIYLCGPVTHPETIEIYKAIFGDHPFDDIKQLRGILHASVLIGSKKVNGELVYESKGNETFIKFDAHDKELLSGFRRFHMKYNPERLFS